jgi:hypothetical protein
MGYEKGYELEICIRIGYESTKSLNRWDLLQDYVANSKQKSLK